MRDESADWLASLLAQGLIARGGGRVALGDRQASAADWAK